MFNQSNTSPRYLNNDLLEAEIRGMFKQFRLKESQARPTSTTARLSEGELHDKVVELCQGVRNALDTPVVQKPVSVFRRLVSSYKALPDYEKQMAKAFGRWFGYTTAITVAHSIAAERCGVRWYRPDQSIKAIGYGMMHPTKTKDSRVTYTGYYLLAVAAQMSTNHILHRSMVKANRYN